MGMQSGEAAVIHRGEQAGSATRSQPRCCARPARRQVHPLAANVMHPGWEDTVQGWQGCAVTQACTDGRNKMFPSLLFPDRHVAKVRRRRAAPYPPPLVGIEEGLLSP